MAASSRRIPKPFPRFTPLGRPEPGGYEMSPFSLIAVYRTLARFIIVVLPL